MPWFADSETTEMASFVVTFSSILLRAMFGPQTFCENEKVSAINDYLYAQSHRPAFFSSFIEALKWPT